MKNRYRKFLRGNVYWSHDSQTGKQASLKTKNEKEAVQLLNVKNHPYQNAAYNLEMARTHLKFGDETLAKRTWSDVFANKTESVNGNTRIRWITAEFLTEWDSHPGPRGQNFLFSYALFLNASEP
jgi:hypothetical protein